MKPPKKRPAVQYFKCPVDPYRKDIFVCTGFANMAQVRRRIGKVEPWAADWLNDRERIFDELAAKDAHAFVMIHPDRGAGIIRLRSYSDCWDFWETLVHELHHYVEFLAHQCKFDDEVEAKAYLQEHLFRSIRRRLQGV